MKLFKVIDTSFDNFDTTVKNYLSKIFNSLGLQYTHNQVFGVIYDGIKGIMLNVMFYIEDALTELNIFTASRKKSILSLAKISGYEAYYGSAATGTVIIKLKNNNDIEYNKIYIKNHTRIIDNNTNIKYFLDLGTDYYIIDVTKPVISYEFKVIEGTMITNTFTSNGYNLETVSVENTGLFDSNYITVYVNGEKWEQVSNLYEMSEDSYNYMIKIGYDNIFDVMFGNGTYGKIPESGSTITVEYLSHNGSIGNIDTNSTFNLEFYDDGYTLNNNSINLNNYLSVNINTFITGGTNSDTIKLIKSMVGYASRSLVIANEDNFAVFLKRFSFVGNYNIWSEKNSMTISACITLNISDKIDSIDDYFDMNDNDVVLDQTYKDMILTVLDNSKKTFAGVSINFIDPVLRKYAILAYIKIDVSYNKETIKEAIKDVIGNYFINIEKNTTFISKTTLIKEVLDNVEGITYFDITIISDLAELTYHTGYYDKYYLEYINGTYDYYTKRVVYETDKFPGLDDYGNIQIDTKLEIPVLRNNIKYYSYQSKSSTGSTSITLDAINFYFI